MLRCGLIRRSFRSMHLVAFGIILAQFWHYYFYHSSVDHSFRLSSSDKYIHQVKWKTKPSMRSMSSDSPKNTRYCCLDTSVVLPSSCFSLISFPPRSRGFLETARTHTVFSYNVQCMRIVLTNSSTESKAFLQN